MFYNNLDILFNAGGCKFHAVNLVCSPITHNIPFHSHGKNCYEIHYISEGYGTLNADGENYEITPNTLFVTGPLVSHSQITDLNSPMFEWCVYLRTDESNNEKYSDIISKFLSEKFWIGQDGQGLLPLFQKLFRSLKIVLTDISTWRGFCLPRSLFQSHGIILKAQFAREKCPRGFPKEQA